MASIGPKRPDGTYRARYRDGAGKEHARHFARKINAQRWLDEQTAALVRGDYTDPKASSVHASVVVDAWLRCQVHLKATGRTRVEGIARNYKRFLAADQVEALADACGPHGGVVRFLAYTGLRWGEMAALRVCDVDPLRRRVHVRRSVTEDNVRLVFDTTKTGEGRVVPLPRFLADQVAELCAGRDGNDLVFEGQRGGVLRNRNFGRRTFAPVAVSVGEPHLTPHGLQHTAASLAIAAGANVKVVQQMLGHKTASMTLDLYEHLFPDQLDDVADRLDVIGRAAAANSADFLRTRGEVRLLPDVAASG
jgi:integrase